ncbi:uncharacterized protein V1510DRAFT_141720 [Dipodascopsis tothii]|uniref:uncharacterized protein n=1 Tax=Dipodascopsis tothii TaxID=44089 RepID=UPI0034CF3A7E
MSGLFDLKDSKQATDSDVASLFAVANPIVQPSRSDTRKQLARKLEELEDDSESDGDKSSFQSSPSVTNKKIKSGVTAVSAKRQKTGSGDHTAAEKKSKRKSQAKKEEENDASFEDRYMKKVADTADNEIKEVESESDAALSEAASEDSELDNIDSDDDSVANSDIEAEESKEPEEETEDLTHESMKSGPAEEYAKAQRTLFVGNVNSSVISSKADAATLKKTFTKYGKVQSIRFRSIAFSEILPRKVAFVQQKLHEKRSSVHAYIVMEDEKAARAALAANGSVVLDKHIRVDSVAHPAKQDTSRCVFVGNLDFEIEDEPIWQHFRQCGDVEYVRVIRDSKTNVGKGFAYVQFKDSVFVGKALLLDGKKMANGRKLRISRAKFIRKPPVKNDTVQGRNSGKKVRGASAASGYVPKLDPETKSAFGRMKKVVGKAERAQLEVFEGSRASVNSKATVGLKGTSGNKKKGKPRIRARSTAFKKADKQK